MNLFYARVVVFVLLSLLLSLYARAQIDSAYIRSFEQDFSIKPHVYYNFTSLTHEIDNDEGVTYRPNSPIALGFGVAYRNAALVIGWGFDFMRDQKKGDTKSLDLQYHYYGRKLVGDIFFQRYSGFYTKEEDRTYTLYPDIHIVQYGVHGQYVFNHRKFSYKAAFDQSERQRRSAGSWQLGGGVYYNEIASDSTLYLNIYKKIKNYQLSASGGYVYTWVVNRRLFVSGGVSVGVNVGTQNIRTFEVIEVSPSFFPRLSVGYVARRWSLGFSALVNKIYVTRTDTKMLFDTGSIQVSYTKRFDSSPEFLKKIKWLN